MLTRYVTIGSLCQRHDSAMVARIIQCVRETLPRSSRLHTFGVKTNVLQVPGVGDALDFADSTAYEFRAWMQESRNT